MKTELHCHSLYSKDCKLKLKDIFKIADKKNLDFISITDHDNVKSQKKAKKMEKDYNVKYIPGLEISKKGHVLAYGIETVPEGNLQDILDYVKSQHGFCIAAHPFGEFLRPSFSKKELEKFNAIEVINGMSFNGNNRKADNIADELRKTKVSGSDAHFLEDIGRFACELTGNGFFQSLRKGKVKLPRKKTNPIELIRKRFKKKFLY